MNKQKQKQKQKQKKTIYFFRNIKKQNLPSSSEFWLSTNSGRQQMPAIALRASSEASESREVAYKLGVHHSNLSLLRI